VAEIDGTCTERFQGVRDAFTANFDRGDDVGASCAVVVDGELVVDLWGGTLDVAGTEPWRTDTITNVWSTTKTMTALSALLLADRGELDLHAPVARYWPEFKANGKEGVEVRHLLAHAAGLSGWAEPLAAEDLYDWEKCTSLLAAQEPWWAPGTQSGYHAVTQGYLVGEVVRRASGAASLGTFFREELAEPLGADFHIGTPASRDADVAKVIAPPLSTEEMSAALNAMGPDSILARTFTNPPLSAEQSHDVAWRRAEIPAAGGHGNARSVARVQSVLALGGTVDGRRYLSEAGCRAALEEVVAGTDLVLQMPLRFAMGYALIGTDIPLAPVGNAACFWGGWGGSIVVVDQTARMVVAYVMNRMGEGTMGDTRGLGIALAAYEALAH
jgi:CubicO group peptidase (beta-lactamase class C family)